MIQMWNNIDGEEVIAQLVDRDQIPNFLKEAIVGPGEAVMYIRNGKIEDVLTQTKLEVSRQGVIDWFRSKMGGGESVQLLFVSTVPMDMNLQIGKSMWKLDPSGKPEVDQNGQPEWEVQGILSRDNEEVKGTCTMRVQINQNNVTRIINLMRSAEPYQPTQNEKHSTWWGRNRNIFTGGILKKLTFQNRTDMAVGKFLFKSDLEELINDEALVGVLTPQLSAVEASDIKGNLDLIKQIETTAEVELRKTMEMWGLNLLKLYMVFDRTASDALAAHKKKQTQIFEQAEFDKDFDMKASINILNRDYEVDKTSNEKEWALAFGGQAGADRLASMQLTSSLERDSMAQTHDRDMSGMAHDENIRQQRDAGMTDVDIQRAQNQADIDKEKGEAQIAMDAFAQVQEAKRMREAQEQDHVEDMKKMDVDTQQMGVTTADAQISQLQTDIHELEMKIIDAPTEKLEILQKMYDQKTIQMQSLQQEATKRQLGTVGGEASEEFMRSEGQKHNISTYRDAEDRERNHQVDMTGQAAKMMESSKQNVPQYVGGGGYGVGQQPVNVITVDQSKQGVQPAQQQQSGNKCPSCMADTQPGWKACPACGGSLSSKPSCPHCGSETQPGWKACPSCGNAL